MVRGVTVGVLVLLACAGCGASDAGSDAKADSTVLEAAYEKCGRPDESPSPGADPEIGGNLSVGDQGHTLTIESSAEGELSALLTVASGMCVLEAAGAPDAVSSQVEQTTALMGRQEAEWDSITMSYSYHPDNGLSAVLTER